MATRKYRISQEAFDGAVQENIEEFGMEKEEAIEDAIKTFSMQGADISGNIYGHVAPTSQNCHFYGFVFFRKKSARKTHELSC